MTALRTRTGGRARLLGGAVAGALFGAGLAVLLLAGCSVDQEIAVQVNGAGEAAVRVELQPVFVDYLLALAEVAADELPDDPGELFDVAEVEAAIAGWPGVEAAQIATPSAEQLEMRLIFADLQEAFSPAEPGPEAGPEAGAAPLISLTGDERRTLSVHLDGANYHQLTTLFPILEHPLVISLGPQPDLEVTDDEYLEMMQFVLGDDGPPAILDSEVTVRVRVEGRVVEQHGGELQADGSVLIRIPLLRILVLDQPLDYRIVFE